MSVSETAWTDGLALSDDENRPDPGDQRQSDESRQGDGVRRSGSFALVGGTLQGRSQREREKCRGTRAALTGGVLVLLATFGVDTEDMLSTSVMGQTPVLRHPDPHILADVRNRLSKAAGLGGHRR